MTRALQPRSTVTVSPPSLPHRTLAARGLAAALAVLALAGRPGAAAAEPAPAAPAAPILAGDAPTDFGPRAAAQPADPASFPRLGNGRPDFTGVWFAGIKDLISLMDDKVDVPLTPEYQAVRQKRLKAMADGKPLPDYVSTCQAFGMPRLMSYGVFELVARPEQVWVISEVLHEVRRIYVDGKPHGAFQEKSFNGVSSAHWEGDVLVVTTEKLRAGYLSMTGAPHSDRMRITERIRMVNPDAIENVLTITDPVALLHPWTIVQRYDRKPAGFEISEYNCLENYRDGGGATPPPESDPGAMLPTSAVSDDQEEGTKP